MADTAGVDYVLSLTPETIGLAEEIRATPVLITADPEDLDGLHRMAARLEQLDHPYLLDSILAPINSGFAASLARYVEVRRRHPEAEMLMGVGNLTGLTEADSTGVTALLIGFCQEVGIRAVLTTEVIGWARGVVRETVRAAQIMHLAQRQARPPKHIDAGLLTAKDESMRAPSEEELHAMQEQISDANYRLFADAEWLYALNGERFVRDTNMYALFEQLGVQGDLHAFYLGKELMKADDRARAAQELSPGGATGLGAAELSRTSTGGHLMKKILIQLDTDQHPSAFDAIAAYDSDVDVVLGFAQINPENLDAMVQGAIFPRGPDGLANTVFWVGGSKVRDGEAVFEAAQKLFFEPFKPSIMLDSDGSNTTAAAAVALARRAVTLKDSRAAVVGVGPVGLRTAELLRREGAEVTMLTFPPDVMGGGHRRASGIPVAQDAGFEVLEPTSSDELDAALTGRAVVFAAGPAGTQIVRRSSSTRMAWWWSTTRRPSPSASRGSSGRTC